MRPIRIGISGKMMSGKSIVADYLVREYGFVELRFASVIYMLARSLFGMRAEEPKNRALLQAIGMKFREIDPDVWVNDVLCRMPKERDGVVSDVRIPNEYDALRAQGFQMVRIYVSQEVQEQRIQAEIPDMPRSLRYHYSEIALDGPEWQWDEVIRNAGCSMEELLQQVDHALQDIRIMNERRAA